MRSEPKMGLLLIGSPRFKPLGEGSARGSYAQRKERDAAVIVGAARSIGEVVYGGIVYDRPGLSRAMKSFYASDVDYVLAIFVSWAEDFSWARFLRDMYALPLLFAHVARERCRFSDTSGDDEFTDFLCAGGLVGTLEASGSIKRMGRGMVETAVGTLDEVMAAAARFGRAAALRSRLRNSAFGLLASYNEAMWSTYVDPYLLFKVAGPELRFVPVTALEEAMAAIAPVDAERARDAIAARYPVLPDVDPAKFLASVHASMGVEKLAAEGGLDLVVLNDIDTVLFRRVGLRPGFIPSDSISQAIAVPEGDVGAGLAYFILKELSGEHVNFIEPFHIEGADAGFAAGHAGPNDYADPRGSVKVARDVRFAKTSYKHAGAPFAWYVIPSGVKTMLHVSQCGDGLKMACALVDAQEATHTLASYSHGILRPRIPVHEFFKRLVDIGVTQHFALAPGDHIASLRSFAAISGIEFHAIN